MRRERKIGLGLATLLVASNIVGSGLFLLPATLAAYGSMTVVGWLVATAGALLVARVLGRLGRHAPEPGGACAYATRALGPAMGFQATAVYWISCWTGNVAIAVAAIGYLATFFPALARPAPLAWAAVGLIWLLAAVNLLGARRVCQLELVALAAGVIPILIVALGGWGAFHWAIFRHAWNVSGHPAWRALPPAMVLIFWAFIGIESASIATAVVENPERNVERATYYGVLLAAAIYLVSCSVIMGIIPAATLARSTAPFADAVGILLGPAAAALVAVMALVKVVGSIAGWILLTIQTGEAGEAVGLFPAVFAARPGRAPWANLAIVAGLMSAGVLATVSPTLGEQFGKLITVSVILTLLLYVYACLAVWHYAAAAPEAFRHDRSYALAAMLFCLAVIVFSAPALLALAAGVALLTLGFYPFCRARPPAALKRVAKTD